MAKINPNSSGSASLIYSTYLGGSLNDAADGIAVDGSGNAYVTGFTYSTNFPVTAGVLQASNGGSADAFVTKLGPSGATLSYSTYLGGTSDEQATGIVVDRAGEAYVVGGTSSSNFPTTAGAYQTASRGGSDVFVTKINANGTGAVYSTHLGGSLTDVGTGIALDAYGNAFVTGYTSSTDFPTTTNAYQLNSGGGQDAFVARLSPSGSTLTYSSYLGGNGTDACEGIAGDPAGNVFVAGYTLSGNFPATTGAFQTTAHGGQDAFVSKFHLFMRADFDRDGNTDLILLDRSPRPGYTQRLASLWYMNNNVVNGGSNVSWQIPDGWQIAVVGDFNGDGKPDLVLQNLTTLQIAVWYLDNNNVTGSDNVSWTLPPGWQIAGVGDFNGDGRPDLILENLSTLQLAVWYLNGPVVTGGNNITWALPANQKVIGVGDFNGDGWPDLVLQDTAPRADGYYYLSVWYLNNYVVTGGNNVTWTLPANVTAVGVGDFNGDGQPDLIFQDLAPRADGFYYISIWYLNNYVVTGGANVSWTLPASQDVVGPR